MTKKETIRRNLGLTFDFVKYLIANPKEIDNLPNKFELEFIDKDFIIEEKSPVRNNKKIINKIVKVKNSFELIN